MDVQDSSTQTELPPLGQARRLRLFGKLLLLGLSIQGTSWVVAIKNSTLGEMPEADPAILRTASAQAVVAPSSTNAGPVKHVPEVEPRRPATAQTPAPAVVPVPASPTESARRGDEGGADTDLNDKAPARPFAAWFAIYLFNDLSTEIHNLLTEVTDDTRLVVSWIKSLPSRPSNVGCTLINPATNRVPIRFLLNGEEQLLGAGKSRTWNFDQPAIIEFDRGRDHGVARYSVSNESFTFKITRQGWDLVATSDHGLTEPD